MLRFIVLGDLPGTDVNLTFLQVLLLLGIMYTYVYRRWIRVHRAPQQSSLDLA